MNCYGANGAAKDARFALMAPPYSSATPGTAYTALTSAGVGVESFCDHLLVEPWQLKTQSGGPFRVFSPFYRALQAAGDPLPPVNAPESIPGASRALLGKIDSVRIKDLGLLPKIKWDAGFYETWTPGEAGASARLDEFINGGLAGYAGGRDRIDETHTSRLSPHLRFGEISPRQVRHAVSAAKASSQDRAKFLAELGWREFSYHLLFHNPQLATRNFTQRFDACIHTVQQGQP